MMMTNPRGTCRGTMRWPRLVAWLALVLIIAAGPGARAFGARAQSDGERPEDGFRLVARMLPAAWLELAATVGTPAAENADVGAEDPSTARSSPESLEGAALVEALRGGGYVIYFRHAATDFDQQDSDRQNLEECDTQRNLNDAGRTDARRIGDGFAALGLPVGDVLSGEYCRTRETAAIAFGRVTLTPDLTSLFAARETGNEDSRRAALRRLLATAPRSGTNTVLVGHEANLEAATGVVISEGEAAIFLPSADGGTPTATTWQGNPGQAVVGFNVASAERLARASRVLETVGANPHARKEMVR